MTNNAQWLLERAGVLLGETNTVMLSSIRHDGYPRIVTMTKLYANGLKEIYFESGVHEDGKVEHYRINNKAGVAFEHNGNNITLIGDIEIIDDEESIVAFLKEHKKSYFVRGKSASEYVILKFVAKKAMLNVDGQFLRLLEV